MIKNEKEEKVVENEVKITKVYVELPPFTGRNVPLEEIAKATHKSADVIRYGLRDGFYKFGTAYIPEYAQTYTYFCPDKKVWEETGYFNYDYKENQNG